VFTVGVALFIYDFFRFPPRLEVVADHAEGDPAPPVPS
jgi:hypothetical protein